MYMGGENKCRNWDKMRILKLEKARWSACGNAWQKICKTVSRRGLHSWWKDGKIPKHQSQERETEETAGFMVSTKTNQLLRQHQIFF